FWDMEVDGISSRKKANALLVSTHMQLFTADLEKLDPEAQQFFKAMKKKVIEKVNLEEVVE
ncbi:hypothetical protein HK096_011630, partial [Nowakowskiella sp. JEL0078]